MSALWQRFQDHFVKYNELGFSIDISRMRFPDGFFEKMQPAVKAAFAAMQELEAGGIANPDEKRMVGHYWLRNPTLAPNDKIRDEITQTKARVQRFASDVQVGRISAPSGRPFEHGLVIGIGGSALGPQFIADALGSREDALDLFFLDNTDPDGFDRVLERLGKAIDHTLTVVISKSGGTKETRNGMLETKARYERAGLDFGRHAVAVTGEGSELDQYAAAHDWIARFPMFDWVGGRTSVMSAVGLLPAALQGLDTEQFLAGAAAMDARTRQPNEKENAAMLLALMWYYAGDGQGKKDMVIIPYKDRLALFSKYLQHLVMESLGKEKDRAGQIVHQGIAVYGNKGSTDQHAYVQQLRDGVANFFVTFIEVRKDRADERFEVEEGVTSGDYLQGFLRGTRAALYEKERDSITLSIAQVDAFHVGAMIALYERAVGFYGSLVNINAYDQPGVEAGKKAATRLLQLQPKILAQLGKSEMTAAKIAEKIGADPEEVYHLLTHLAANDASIQVRGDSPGTEEFSRIQ